MTLFLLYLTFLKAALSSFSGLASLPVVRDDLVVKQHLITDRDLNTAIVIGRSTPGPKGLFVISLGHYIAGFPGAKMAWLALLTPALLVIPMVRLAGRYVDHPDGKRVLQTVTLATAGLSLSATLPLAADSLKDPATWTIALVSIILLVWKRYDATWVMLGAGAGNLLFHYFV